MGNRGGRFHDDDQRLGARRWASRRWIACLCEFRGRRRRVWGAGYTELFFLDEPTALAAGHRPCFECRRADAVAFARALSPGAPLAADAIDSLLDAERREGRRRRRHRAPVASLPDGAFIAREGHAWAVRGDALWPWSFSGYGPPLTRPRSGDIELVTPPATVRALANGYRPAVWGPNLPFGNRD